MKGPQGDIFWRSAFVNLEMFSKIYRQKIYQIRFVHTLPESDCNRGSQQCTVCKYQKCPTANVAIDNIRLDCQEVIKVPLEMCKERTATLSGCEIHANMPLTTGMFCILLDGTFTRKGSQRFFSSEAYMYVSVEIKHAAS